MANFPAGVECGMGKKICEMKRGSSGNQFRGLVRGCHAPQDRFGLSPGSGVSRMQPVNVHIQIPRPMTQPQQIALLGATGSIGKNTLDVVRHSGGRFQVRALTAHRQLDLLCQQAKEFQPAVVVITDEAAAKEFDCASLPKGTQLLVGPDKVTEVVRDAAVDVVVAAIVGSAGLLGTWGAIEAGKRVALANKETLVMAGPLAMQRAKETGATIIPVDSEHSAIFQALHAGRRQDLARVVLTASGGPFRQHSLEQIQKATVKEALAHPIWQMGPKITIDSATLMNKALEVIEARWLFDLASDQVAVMIHPQSVVHSLVEFTDGSVVAQLGPPDMRLPIQYALTYPERQPCPGPKMDWRRPWELYFEPPDEQRFPALRLGLEVAAAGGTAGAVLNAANEAAVAAFLAERIRLPQIVDFCRKVLDQHTFDPQPTLEQLLELDRWARQETERWMAR
jgi:1-deoxy-D-xylulose-5-phosphate reductoisomerase